MSEIRKVTPGNPPQVLRFVHVVQLFAQAVAHLSPDRREVGVGEQREQRLQQAPQVDEVGLDDLVDARVLDLYRAGPLFAGASASFGSERRTTSDSSNSGVSRCANAHFGKIVLTV